MSSVWCLCGFRIWGQDDGHDRQSVTLGPCCEATNNTTKSPHYKPDKAVERDLKPPGVTPVVTKSDKRRDKFKKSPNC